MAFNLLSARASTLHEQAKYDLLKRY